MKSKKQLDSFVEYCTAHPEERFWQALRNWTRETINPNANFILTAEIDRNNIVGYRNLRDTFYD